LNVLDTLSTQGPPQAMLDDMRVARDRQVNDPVAAPGIAWAAAGSALTGSEIYTFEQLRELAAAVTPRQVARVVGHFRHSVVLGVPQGAEPPQGLDVLRGGTTAIVPGSTRHLHGSGKAALWLSDDALQHTGNGRLTTVHLADVAAMLEFPDGARQVVSLEGWTIFVEPTVYLGAARVVEALDARVPEELRLPQPERAPEHIPKRVGMLKRVWSWFRRYAPVTPIRRGNWLRKLWRIVVALFTLWVLLRVAAIAFGFVRFVTEWIPGG
jgi:hypothetical protein